MTRQEVREWIQILLMPAAVAFAGYWVAKSNATRETNAEYVRMAIDVLAHDSTHADRVWAAKVLARFSEVPFTAEAESILVQVGQGMFGQGLFAEVVGRQFNRLLVCDSVGHKCRPMVIEKPLPITDVPGPQVAQIVVSPTSITLLSTQVAYFTAYGRTTAGESIGVAVTWSATGGSIDHGRFTAPSVPGHYTVMASSSGLAGTALVHVQRL